MMTINIIAVGKIKEDYITRGIAEYASRLENYCNLNIQEVQQEKISGEPSQASSEKIKKREGRRIISRIPEHGYTIVLDVKGKPMTSEGLAKSLSNLQVQGESEVSFIIGGTLGISQEVLDAADYSLSLSHMTFTHQMIRLILLEQIYRAFKIIANEPYHR